MWLGNIETKKLGTLLALFAFGFWGFLPVYYSKLNFVNTAEVMAYRCLGTFFFVFIFSLLNKRTQSVKNILSDKKLLFSIFLCAFFLSIDWFLYVWAIYNNRVLESTIGCFTAPLFTSLLGRLLFAEKVNKASYVAMGAAFLGVLWLVLKLSHFPWVAVGIVLSLAVYASIKKSLSIHAIDSFLLEAMFLAIPATFYIAFCLYKGNCALLLVNTPELSLILLLGLFSMIPGLSYTAAAQRIPLSSLGMFAQITPLINVALAISYFGEVLTHDHMIAYFFILLGVSLFILSKLDIQINTTFEILAEKYLKLKEDPKFFLIINKKLKTDS